MAPYRRERRAGGAYLAGRGGTSGQTAKDERLRTDAHQKACGNRTRREGRPRICAKGRALALAFPAYSVAREGSKLTRRSLATVCTAQFRVAGVYPSTASKAVCRTPQGHHRDRRWEVS